jgi:ATP-dependent DNA helicase RecG
MKKKELQQLVALGEDSGREFKEDIHNPDSLGAELVAFSNSGGGLLLIGVTDDGTIVGLAPADVRRLNQMIGNAASQHIRSPISPQTENVSVGSGRVVIVVRVPEGIDKPYFDRLGVVWLKAGADKRRVQSKEELRRLFQEVDLLYADQVPTTVGLIGLDRIRLRDFLAGSYQQDLPADDASVKQLLENMNLAKNGKLNLAGLLLFGRQPQIAKPMFVVKAIRYPGAEIASQQYLDSEDFAGPLREIFDGALRFVLRNLPKIQGTRSVNEPGRPLVPAIVFEELLVNALVHRDYFIQAPVRLFMFDDRVEIISPGCLPDHLTVQKILAGNSVIRNPILASFASKGLLPYRGLGTGVRRALSEWPALQFTDDRDANTFLALIRLEKAQNEPIKNLQTRSSEPIAGSLDENKVHLAPDGEPLRRIEVQLLNVLRGHPEWSYDELGKQIGIGRSTVMRHIRVLKQRGLLQRVGTRKTGHWKVHLHQGFCQ